MAKITKSFSYGGKTVTIETGEVARQAGGAHGRSAAQSWEWHETSL